MWFQFLCFYDIRNLQKYFVFVSWKHSKIFYSTSFDSVEEIGKLFLVVKKSSTVVDFVKILLLGWSEYAGN